MQNDNCEICKRDHQADNPCCPKCRHYNALLGTGEYIVPGDWKTEVRKCRDCGHEVYPNVDADEFQF